MATGTHFGPRTGLDVDVHCWFCVRCCVVVVVFFCKVANTSATFEVDSSQVPRAANAEPPKKTSILHLPTSWGVAQDRRECHVVNQFYGRLPICAIFGPLGGLTRP